MFNRFEFKYLVKDSDVDAIRGAILPFVNFDKFARATGRNEYTVRSIYYDTINFSSYYEKIEGLAFRRKFRIRGYNDKTPTSKVFIEIKNKRENFVDKNRASLPADCVNSFIKEGCFDHFGPPGALNGGRQDAELFMYHLTMKNLKPTSLIVYDREAFEGKFQDSLRITFDKNLRSRIFPMEEDLFCDNALTPSLRSHFILEFKFKGGVPLWFKYVTEKFDLTRRALSKYVICLDSQVKHDLIQLYAHSKMLPYTGNFLFKRNLI